MDRVDYGSTRGYYLRGSLNDVLGDIDGVAVDLAIVSDEGWEGTGRVLHEDYEYLQEYALGENEVRTILRNSGLKFSPWATLMMTGSIATPSS